VSCDFSSQESKPPLGPSQQLQGQLQTQHSVDINNSIMEQYSINSKKLQGSTGEKNALMQKSKQTNKKQSTDNNNTNNNFINSN
jgi:hypothetical protein